MADAEHLVSTPLAVAQTWDPPEDPVPGEELGLPGTYTVFETDDGQLYGTQVLVVRSWKYQREDPGGAAIAVSGGFATKEDAVEAARRDDEEVMSTVEPPGRGEGPAEEEA